MRPFGERTNITFSSKSSSRIRASNNKTSYLRLNVDTSMVSTLQEQEKSSIYLTSDDQR